MKHECLDNLKITRLDGGESYWTCPTHAECRVCKRQFKVGYDSQGVYFIPNAKSME